MTYLTPQGRRRRQLHRRPARRSDVRIDAAGGWWDAGDYLKFVETTSYTDAVLLAAVRDFPRQIARARARLELRGRGAVRRALAAADVGRQDAHALLPGRDRRGQRHTPSATTTSGGCRRPTTTTAARARGAATSATGPVFRAGPPGLAGQPQPGRARRRRVRPLLPGLPAHASRRLAARCLRSGEHIFALADTTPGPAPDGDPVRLLPRDGVARRPRAGRDRARDRDGARPPARRAAAPALALLPAPRRALGARLHHRPERRRRHAQPVRRERPCPLRPRTAPSAPSTTRPGCR